MKAKLVSFLFLSFAACTLYAQTITPQVVNSTGGTFQKGYYIMDWSVGELALVNEMQTSKLIVTNGYIQPFTHDPGEQNNDVVFGDGEIRILPNPTRDILEVNFRTRQQGRVLMTMVDVAGNILFKKELSSFGNGQIEKVDMRRFSHGSYFLKINLIPSIGFTKKSGTYKIIKLR